MPIFVWGELRKYQLVLVVNRGYACGEISKLSVSELYASHCWRNPSSDGRLVCTNVWIKKGELMIDCSDKNSNLVGATHPIPNYSGHNFSTATLIFCVLFWVTLPAIAQDRYTDVDKSECFIKLSAVVRIIEEEFNRSPKINNKHLFWGLYTWTYESHNVLEENRRKVRNLAPIHNCLEEDVRQAANATSLKPEPFFKNGNVIVVFFETKFKSAQFVWNPESQTVERAILHGKKLLMEDN